MSSGTVPSAISENFTRAYLGKYQQRDLQIVTTLEASQIR